ncbi:MAG: hypothetical protein ACSLFR_05550 [Solirubrobacteraceae bacterium]
MRERATLRLDAGDQVRVEVDRLDLDRDEIVVHRTEPDQQSANSRLLEVIDRHLATATPHSAGTTDRLLQADRDRPY